MEKLGEFERLLYLLVAFAFIIPVSGYLIPPILFLQGKESFNSFTLIALLVNCLLLPSIFTSLIAAITGRDLLHLFQSKPTH